MVSATAADASATQQPVLALFNVAMVGHVNPTFPLVMELARRGCRVHYFLPPDEGIRRAARAAGAQVEGYLAGDPEDFALERAGSDELEGVPEEDRVVLHRAVWPLASTLLCGEYLIDRCRSIGAQAVLYDPTTPHGLLAAEALGLPCMSLVTFPGMGAVAGVMSNAALAECARDFRRPLGRKIQERFGVDVRAQMLSRRQYLAPRSLITTSEDLVTPLPPAGEHGWADEVRDHFSFEAVGCMVSDKAPHVAGTQRRDDEHPAASGQLFAQLPEDALKRARADGAKVVYAALGTMALGDLWTADLGAVSGGNLPAGTTGKQFCQHVWRCLLDAFAQLRERAFCVLCVGSRPDALDFLPEGAAGVPSNVAVRASAPQVKMLGSYADVFVSHVGFNSLQESIIAGVPLIAVPQAVDQPANARKVESAGWGKAFLQPMESVTVDSIRDAIVHVADPKAPYRKSLSEAGASLRGGDVRAADRLLALCATAQAACGGA